MRLSMKLVKFPTSIIGGIIPSLLLFSILSAQAQTFKNIHNFIGANFRSSPYGGVIQSGTLLYSVTWGGGNGTGEIFRVNSNGTGKTVIYNFSAFSTSGTNSDGAEPYASLLLSGTTLYGTASAGGASGWGAV